MGEALVKHPLISAVGFTGSLVGGRALFDLCAQRPKPIPFFGELGSVNPMFMLPGAVLDRGEEIGRGWAASLTMGAGQFCTNPGIIVVIEGEPAERLINAAKDALTDAAPQTMLTDGIAAAYQEGQKRISSTAGVRSVLTTMCDQRQATPYLYETDGATWLADESLGHEVFGPLGLVVKVSDFEQMLEVAKHLDGQLTCTLHATDDDSFEFEPRARLFTVRERQLLREHARSVDEPTHTGRLDVVRTRERLGFDGEEFTV